MSGHAGGRPTKYDPKYCEMAIDIIGKQGKSVVQFARDIGVSRATVYNWMDENPEFLDSLTHAKDWAEAFWEDQFTSYMLDKNVNAPLVKLYFANRFKWAEKEQDGPIDDMATALKELAQRLPA